MDEPARRSVSTCVVTLGNRRPKVTATFFNAKFLKKSLVEGTRLMLSGEVGYFKGTMQLTHPAFLVLESPSGKTIGTKSLKTIAATSGATGDELLSAFERDFFPIYPANEKVQSWDIYACVRQVLDVLDPIDEPLPKSVLQQRNLMSEDEALRAIHLAENTAERERARRAAHVRRGGRAAVGVGGAAIRRTERIRSRRASRRRRTPDRDARAAAVRTDRRPNGSAGGAVGRTGGEPADEPHAAG